MSREAAALWYRRRRLTHGLDLRSVGTFTRSGEKGGQSSSSSLSWYATDTRCMEDRGDGAGSLLVLEGAYKQWVVRNRDYGDAAWTKTSWNAGTPLIAAPDGVTEAQPQATAITSNACRAFIGITGSDAGIPDASRVCHSVWAVDAAGEVFRFRQTGQDNVVSNSSDLTTSDYRLSYDGTTYTRGEWT